MTIDTGKSNGWLKECQLFKKINRVKKFIGSFGRRSERQGPENRQSL